jgi:adenylate cyclase
MRVGVLAAGAVAGAGLLFSHGLEPLREGGIDALMHLSPRRAAEMAPVLAVAVTDADLARFGPWPWPRAVLARLVAQIAGAGAVAVALDVTMSESAEGDAELVQALATVPSVVAVLEGAAPANATPTTRNLAVALIGRVDLAGLPALPGIEPTALPGVIGALGALPGQIVRAVPLLARVGAAGTTEGDLIPGLALATLTRALGEETLLLRDARPPLLQIGRYGLPLPAGGLLRLDPPDRPVPVVSAGAMMSGQAAGQAKGRIVLLGLTAAVAPLRPSVFGPFTPSLLVQAEAVAQLAAGWVPRILPGGRSAEAAAGLLLGLVAALAVRRAPRSGLVVALLLAALWPLGALAALRFGGMLVDPVVPALAAVFAGVAETAAAARRLARERLRLLARFAHRLPTGVADRLLATPESERLRPERCQVAVVMTDLAGFTAMVHSSEPAVLVGLLNAYLAGIEAAVLDAGGTLERLIGDSVLAVFGAPVVQTDSPGRALAAARVIDRFAEGFRQRPDAAALGWGATRIGVAAGEVLAGEFGGSRLTWSVCGDAANVAARLQELAKSLGQRALVTGIEDASLPPPLGSFVLRGLDGEAEVRALGG